VVSDLLASGREAVEVSVVATMTMPIAWILGIR
jgi:hypothetical protein